MTYREAIQKLILDIDQVYDSAGSLRDSATLIEKNSWDRVRTHTRNAYQALADLDRNISDARAEMELKYTV